MTGIPVTILDSGIPVRPVDANAPVMGSGCAMVKFQPIKRDKPISAQEAVDMAYKRFPKIMAALEKAEKEAGE